MFRFIRCLENTSTFRHPTHSAFSWKWVQMKGNGFVSSLKSESSSSSTLWLKVNGGTEGETRENEAPVLVGIKMYVPPIRRRQMWTISETNQGKFAPRAFANHTHSHTLICLTCSNSHKEETDTVKPNLSLSCRFSRPSIYFLAVRLCVLFIIHRIIEVSQRDKHSDRRRVLLLSFITKGQ